MATRYRKINLYGKRYVIELMQVDIEDLNLKIGDMIDIEDAVRKTSISKENKIILVTLPQCLLVVFLQTIQTNLFRRYNYLFVQ